MSAGSAPAPRVAWKQLWMGAGCWQLHLPGRDALLTQDTGHGCHAAEMLWPLPCLRKRHFKPEIPAQHTAVKVLELSALKQMSASSQKSLVIIGFCIQCPAVEF